MFTSINFYSPSSRLARIHHLLVWGYNLSIEGSTKENKKKSGADQSEHKKKIDRWNVTIGCCANPRHSLRQQKKERKINDFDQH